MADVLVTTDWVAQHATDAGVRVVEVDVDTTAYDQGHVPGAAGWNWTTELCDTLTRDIVPLKKLEELLGQERHRQQDDHRPVRRQQQLVRGLGVLAAEDVRPRGRPHDGRRPQEVAGRRPRAVAPTSRRLREDLQGERARRVAARVSAGSAAGVGGQEGGARRRAQSRRSSPARSSRRPDFRKPASAAATFPGAKSIPVGQGLQRRRHVQERRRAEGAVRRRRACPATSR